MDLKPFEWRRQLISSAGGRLFNLRYFGQLHKKTDRLITGTSFAPPKVVAVDVVSNEAMLIFDGCQHGYNALFCDEFMDEQIQQRDASTIYTDRSGNEVFSIILSAFYQFDYDAEFDGEVNERGDIELLNGERIPFEKAKREGFDSFRIFGISDSGKRIDILSEELG